MRPLLIIFFEKNPEKIWSVSKLDIILHRFSPQNGRESNSKKEFFDMFATIIDVVQENREFNCSR